MSLYPSLEDMKVDQYMTAERQLAAAQQQQTQSNQPPRYTASLSNGDTAYHPTHPVSVPSHYPNIWDEYMGLNLEPPSGPHTQSQVAVASNNTVATIGSSTSSRIVAPLTSETNLAGYLRGQVSNAIRQVILCKDANGKLGIRPRAVQKGIFVQFVGANSPASLAGLRFGDQILEVNGIAVAGFSSDKALNMLKKADGGRIVLAIRDRPFERSITLHKDSSGHVGFRYKQGKITDIAKDTSAARNGLLIDHQILEVDGQNVVGITDKALGEVFKDSKTTITVTIIPSFLYDHMMKHMSGDLVRKMMDHSVPELV